MTFKELKEVMGSHYRCQIYNPKDYDLGGFFDVNQVTGEGVDYADDLAMMDTEIILIETVYSERYGYNIPVVVYKILYNEEEGNNGADLSSEDAESD